MTKTELKQRFQERITGLIMDGTIKPDSAPELISFLIEVVNEREDFLVTKMAELVFSWEDSMGEEDKTLYTLGIRRAIDVVREVEYKPINGEDFRDFKRPFDLPPRETDDSSN